MDRGAILLLDFHQTELNFDILEQSICPEADGLRVFRNILAINFSLSSLLVSQDQRLKVKQLQRASQSRLLFTVGNYKKALSLIFSSDSLLKAYGGQLDEPVFDLCKLINS